MSELIGRLAAIDITSADTDTTLYTVPSDKAAAVSIHMCNRNNTAVTIRIAHVDGAGIGSVANADYILYDSIVEANGAETIRTGITMAEADTILVRSDTTSVNFIAWGSEVDV
jgi:hypothetical protein